MGRRKRGQDIDGVVLLDKPLGCSSNQALQRTRRVFDARKAGHTGSLDPLASGLLPVCLGEATKLSSYLLEADKRYSVTALHGARTATGDLEGEIVERTDTALPPRARIEAVFAAFVGAQQQIPPMYSALKHDGRRLYEHARAGEVIDRPPRNIVVRHIALTDLGRDRFSFEVQVSSGTYVRTLVEDIARCWQGAAHVGVLRRTGIGRLAADHGMVMLEALEAKRDEPAALARHLLSVSTLTAGWPQIRLAAEDAEAIRHGRAVMAGSAAPRADHDSVFPLCLAGPGGELLGLGRIDETGRIAPKRLFVRPLL